MYSFPNIEPVHCSMSSSTCCFFTCTPVYQKADKVVWYFHLFKNFPLCVLIYTDHGFSVVIDAEVNVFVEFPCFICDPADVDNLISGSSAFSKSTLYIWRFSVCLLLKPSLKDFEHNLASMWNGCNYVIVWTLFGIALLWDWNENWHFPVLWSLLSFPNFLAYWL